ncbi:bifunctional 2-polyprenyl-6-hydroxyphenol methylase/3-demethylubiquinol 3-O-methyltransferase UbiG [Streptomyces sp. ST2-7A]|uniref:class I SAM-dependent methyltransferase n=1 Tax=Streptomyces sp. ST2-7A TaxID=2907214 RepID=UPI001F285273|nr:class I SAM-dependent methyltransferase [Streptomyces sp. ST2-7A]MCE7080555.1 class I SAM-dependent methyltransferase [Streptomyces sp. ST2-7A]
MYQEDFAGIYDLVYRAHRDYAREARTLRELVRDRRPGASRLLDVGCGTGEHLLRLRGDFEVAGVDLSVPMVRAARDKLGPDVPLTVGDMRSLALGTLHDVVICLYSAIGYVAGTGELRAAIGRMVDHLVPGGVLIVEPWILRENWNGGELARASFDGNGFAISRMGRWTTREGRSRVDMHYLVATDDGEVRHFIDHQELCLFSLAEYEAAFASAGCAVEYLPRDYGDRGVLVGVRRDTDGDGGGED